jgi:hypothetical protein
VAEKRGRILSEISGYSIETERILVGSHTWDREAKERVELHTLHTDHVTIRSQLKYLIGGNGVLLRWLVIGGKTGPSPVSRVFGVVRPIATV